MLPLKSNDNSYPNKTGFVRHSDTSAESARLLDESGRAGTYDTMIMEFLDKQGEHGATAEEARKYLNTWYPDVHNGSINGRLSTLWRRKEVVKLTECRMTDANKRAHVYVHERLRGWATTNNLADKEYAQVAPDRPDSDAAKAAHQMAQTLFDRLILNRDGGASIELLPLDLAIIENLAKQAGLRKD